MLRKALIVIGMFVFLFAAAPASAKDKYVVIKDSNGKCSVRKAQEKTPKTIAGPFDTKSEAEAAKKEKCPDKK